MSDTGAKDRRVESVAVELWAHNWAIPTQTDDTTMEERLEKWRAEPYWVRSGFMAQARRAVAAADRSASPDDLTDGYHTMAELYRQRMLWHAMFVNTATRAGTYKCVKSRRHHDGEPCFGGGWFIVQTVIDGHVVAQHYESAFWDLFHCREVETALAWDGSTPLQEGDVIQRHLEGGMR